jgi:hypothetical protein
MEVGMGTDLCECVPHDIDRYTMLAQINKATVLERADDFTCGVFLLGWRCCPLELGEVDHWYAETV